MGLRVTPPPPSLSGLYLFLGLVIEVTPRCSLMERDELGESSRPGAPIATFDGASYALCIAPVHAMHILHQGKCVWSHP